MSTSQMPPVGCYRLMRGVTIGEDENGGIVALCGYPLRVVRLNVTTARLLSLCTEGRTGEQLAALMNMSIKRVQALCDQLRGKSLLEVGSTPSPAVWPNVSIIIPSYNRVKELERCLRSLFDLNYPLHLLEILVIDDASTDETCTMLQRLTREATTRGLALRTVHHDKKQGVAISRNIGAEAATYELIAYIDSDCVASVNWLMELVPAFQDDRTAAVGGMIRAYECNTLLGRYEDVCSSLYMGERPQQVCLGGALTYLPTANMLIRRTMWQQLGGFASLTQGEDVDLCRRLLLTGAHIHYVPQGIVYHDYRTTMGAFLRIRAAYATAEAVLLQRHPTERRILVLPPEQATFAGLMIGGGWAALGALWQWMVGRPRQQGDHKGSPLLYPLSPHKRRSIGAIPCGRPAWGGNGVVGVLLLFTALFVTLFGTRKRLQKVRQQRVRVGAVEVFKATLRGHLAYTYHLCRHLTRYYTLPLLLVGVLLPPLILVIVILIGIVVIVDYTRLKPNMNLGQYAFCTILDDCAYEVGVVRGCVKHRTWKPLLPLIKKRMQ